VWLPTVLLAVWIGSQLFHANTLQGRARSLHSGIATAPVEQQRAIAGLRRAVVDGGDETDGGGGVADADADTDADADVLGLDADTDAGGVEPRADTAQMAEIRQQVAALLQKLERAKNGELDEGDADGGGDVSADKPTSADTAPRPDAATTTTTTTTTTGRSSWWSAGKASGVKTRTRQQCHRMLAWGDVCVYENLCTDGLVFYFLDPSGAADVADAKIFYRHQDAVEGAWVLRAVCVCVCVCVCVARRHSQCADHDSSEQATRCRSRRCCLQRRTRTFPSMLVEVRVVAQSDTARACCAVMP
jgi:hypothetical protein